MAGYCVVPAEAIRKGCAVAAQQIHTNPPANFPEATLAPAYHVVVTRGDVDVTNDWIEEAGDEE
jgi:hypothetical protein